MWGGHGNTTYPNSWFVIGNDLKTFYIVDENGKIKNRTYDYYGVRVCYKVKLDN